MIFDDLDNWREGVGIHLHTLDTLVNDRKILKDYLETHLLDSFPEWESIEYNRDFTEIVLTYMRGIEPIITPERISNLDMAWIIRAGYDDRANRRVEIVVYPFGVIDK